MRLAPARRLLALALVLAPVGIAAPAEAGCGNGAVEPGEACDEGARNGAPGVCCTAACTCDVGSQGCGAVCLGLATCRDAGGACLCQLLPECGSAAAPVCNGRCPTGSRCFSDVAGTSCECVPDACSDPTCFCQPRPGLVCDATPCPAPLTCFFCCELQLSVCIGGACSHVSQCPAGTACEPAPLLPLCCRD